MILSSLVAGIMLASGIVRYLLEQYEYAIVDFFMSVVFILIALKQQNIYAIQQKIAQLNDVIKIIEEKQNETGKQ